MIDKKFIEQEVNNAIADTGLFQVETKVTADNRIEVVLDSDTSVDINDCVKVNRELCAALEAAGTDDFELTVFSAGLSEPLKLTRQYVKNIGKEIDVILKSGKKTRGTLLSADDNAIEVESQTSEKAPGAKRKTIVLHTERIVLADIKSTKLVVKV